MNYHAAKAYILNRLKHGLSEQLAYHSLYHTLDVLHITGELCELENVTAYDSLLLKTAALYHDSGFLISNKTHEELGCGIAKESLPNFNYTEEEINRICGMIMATKIPQSPQNKLEEILCDADLDYLGRDDFQRIGQTLFRELETYNILNTELAWNKLQVQFIGKHSYFTATNKFRREPKKQTHLQALKTWVASNS